MDLRPHDHGARRSRPCTGKRGGRTGSRPLTASRARGHRGALLSLPVLVGPRRLSRRQSLLHALRLPDHVALARRAGTRRADLVAHVLDAPRPAPPPGRVARAGRRTRVRRHRRNHRSTPLAARRCARGVRIRRQLALLLLGSELRTTLQRAVARTALLVARDRGAVLHPVSRRAHRRVRVARAAAGPWLRDASLRESSRRSRRASCSSTARASPACITAPIRAPRSCSSARSSHCSCTKIAVESSTAPGVVSSRSAGSARSQCWCGGGAR